MALPPDPSDSAPFTKHKKKKKKSRLEEKNKVNEKGDEERTQGDKEKTQGRNDVKKKKRRHEQMMESEEMRAKEREEGNEEVTTKKKKRKGNGIQPEEASQGDEATRKKKKRKENGIQPEEASQGDEATRKKKKRKGNGIQPEETSQGDEATRKKKKRKGNGIQPEETSQGDEATRKKKKRKGNGIQPEEASQGDEATRKKKKRKGNGIQPEEASQGDEATRKKKKRKGNGIQPEEASQGDEATRKKKKRKGNGIQPEEASQGDEATRKKKKRKGNGIQPEEASQGDEATRKKKKRKGNGIQPEEASQGDEATRKKKKRKENGIQPKVITIDEEMRKKKEREQKKEEIHLHDMSQAELDLGISSSELLEIEEFIPDVRLKSLVVKQKLKRVDLPRFREFKRKGLKLRWGQFSQEENLQIRRNVEDFLKLSGIQTSEELFYPCRFPDRQLHLKGVRASHHFYSRIADGLLRTCEQVYICARKMFDEHTIKGKFSEAEVTALKKLHMIYGNNWKIIGDKLDRSIYACQRRYSVTLGDRGKWTEEETRQLKAAALKHLERVLKSSPNPDSGPSFIQLCTKIPWGKIVKKVDTRSWIQCRYKWFGYLRSRMKAVEPKIIPGAAINTRIRLIQALYELQVEEVSDVDWIEVAKTVGHVTPMCVQKLFHRLKVSRIPSWTQSSFGDIVDHLFEKELPQLQNKLQSVPPSHPVQVYFSLKQLFPPEEHEEFMELDNT